MFGKCFDRSGGVYSIKLIISIILPDYSKIIIILQKTTKERNQHKYFLNEITLHRK